MDMDQRKSGRKGAGALGLAWRAAEKAEKAEKDGDSPAPPGDAGRGAAAKRPRAPDDGAAPATKPAAAKMAPGTGKAAAKPAAAPLKLAGTEAAAAPPPKRTRKKTSLVHTCFKVLAEGEHQCLACEALGEYEVVREKESHGTGHRTDHMNEVHPRMWESLKNMMTGPKASEPGVAFVAVLKTQNSAKHALAAPPSVLQRWLTSVTNAKKTGAQVPKYRQVLAYATHAAAAATPPRIYDTTECRSMDWLVEELHLVEMSRRELTVAIDIVCEYVLDEAKKDMHDVSSFATAADFIERNLRHFLSLTSHYIKLNTFQLRVNLWGMIAFAARAMGGITSLAIEDRVDVFSPGDDRLHITTLGDGASPLQRAIAWTHAPDTVDDASADYEDQAVCFSHRVQKVMRVVVGSGRPSEDHPLGVPGTDLELSLLVATCVQVSRFVNNHSAVTMELKFAQSAWYGRLGDSGVVEELEAWGAEALITTPEGKTLIAHKAIRWSILHALLNCVHALKAPLQAVHDAGGFVELDAKLGENKHPDWGTATFYEKCGGYVGLLAELMKPQTAAQSDTTVTGPAVPRYVHKLREGLAPTLEPAYLQVSRAHMLVAVNQVLTPLVTGVTVFNKSALWDPQSARFVPAGDLDSVIKACLVDAQNVLKFEDDEDINFGDNADAKMAKALAQAEEVMRKLHALAPEVGDAMEPLNFWHTTGRARYSFVLVCAAMNLCIPAGGAATERYNNYLARVLTRFRYSLTPDRVERLCMVAAWLARPDFDYSVMVAKLQPLVEARLAEEKEKEDVGSAAASGVAQ